MPEDKSLSDEAVAAFLEGLKKVDPRVLLRERVRLAGDTLHVFDEAIDLGRIRRIFVVAFGKAASRMTASLESILGDRIERGIVLSNVFPESLPEKYSARLCTHPLLSEENVSAGRAVMELAVAAGEGDLVVCLISGGGSSILTLPAEGIRLDETREAMRQMLRSGAPIDKLNVVRKHLSAVKGGRLLHAIAPAGVVSLILSDVPGDDPSIVASGPTSPDPSTFADAWSAVEQLGVSDSLPVAIVSYLQKGLKGEVEETPKPGGVLSAKVSNHIIGCNRDMLAAMEAHLRSRGFWTMQERRYFEGEARELGGSLAARIRGLAASLPQSSRPYALLAGGESTVRVRGGGLGGRNSELALAAAIGLDGGGECVVLAAGTDGIDGPSDAAGAVALGDTISRSKQIGLDARRALDDNDSYNFFEPLGDLVKTGPTGTNLMDVTLALVGRKY